MGETSELGIEYLAHASFVLTYKDHSLLLDPFADSIWISYDFPKNIQADAIFSSHPHYDHDGGIFKNLHPYWQGDIPFYQNPGTYSVGDFVVQGIKGKHSDPYGKEFGQKNTVFIVEVGSIRIAHWGDNGPITNELAAALTDIDILMLPIDDSYHILKAAEIEEAISILQPDVVIPMHYRIAELEPTAGKPQGLAGIDEYIGTRDNVIMLKSNSAEIDSSLFGDQMRYLVFRHSPAIR
jgi:L-ascorbate metabolism protein UlaG (beta-lactamase superfamily)